MDARRTEKGQWSIGSVVLISALWLSLAAHGAGESEAVAALELDGLLDARRFRVERSVEGSLVAWEGGGIEGAAEEDDEVRTLALPTAEELRLLAEGAGGAADGDLLHAWARVSEALDAVRSLPNGAAIREIESGLENAEDALDEFLEVGAQQIGAARVEVSRLLMQGGEVERFVDRLEAVASRVRLYATGDALAELSLGLVRTVRAVASGDGAECVEGLLALLESAATWGGRELRRDAAESIRSTCDSLLRRASDRGRRCAVSATLDAAWGDLELAADLDCEWSDAAAPSGDTSSGGGEIAVEYAADADRLALRWRREDVDYDDPLKAESRKTSQTLEVDVTCRFGAIDVDVTLLGEWEWYPSRIDSEIEREGIGEAAAGVGTLRHEVGAAGLPSASEKVLFGDLDDAAAALDADRRDDAVDAIEEFVDDLENERWKGRVPDALAREWTDEASRVLPRRRVRRLDVPLAFETAVADGVVAVEVEWDRTDYPTSSPLSKIESRFAVEWERRRGAWNFALGHERKVTTYPAAETKDSAAESFTLDAETDVAAGAFDLEAGWDELSYAARPERNRRAASWDAGWEGTEWGVSWSAAVGRVTTAYPNDPSRGETRDDSEEGTASFHLGTGDLEIGVERARRTAGGGALLRETVTWSATWDGELAQDVDLAVSIEREIHTDWEGAGNDRREFGVTIEMTVGF